MSARNARSRDSRPLRKTRAGDRDGAEALDRPAAEGSPPPRPWSQILSQLSCYGAPSASTLLATFSCTACTLAQAGARYAFEYRVDLEPMPRISRAAVSPLLDTDRDHGSPGRAVVGHARSGPEGLLLGRIVVRYREHALCDRGSFFKGDQGQVMPSGLPEGSPIGSRSFYNLPYNAASTFACKNSSSPFPTCRSLN